MIFAHAPFPIEDGTPKMMLTMIVIAQAFPLDNLKRSIREDTIASITDTELVTAVNNTNIKNANPIILPPAICAKIFGRETNISPGPFAVSPASPENAYTIGITKNPANKATTVSKISIWLTLFVRLTSSLI